MMYYLDMLRLSKNLRREYFQGRINAHFTEGGKIFQERYIIILAKVARAPCYFGFLGLQTSEPCLIKPLLPFEKIL